MTTLQDTHRITFKPHGRATVMIAALVALAVTGSSASRSIGLWKPRRLRVRCGAGDGA